MSISCQHENFDASVEVSRITKGEGGPVSAYEAAITIHCSECQAPMQFVGVPAGMSGEKPMTSPDFHELRVPIVPNGEHVEGLGLGFSIRYGARDA